MHTRLTILLSGIVLTLIGVSPIASAQQMTIRTPYRNASDSFFEQNSISWSGNWKGITFSYGGGALNVPQFGGALPNSGLSANFGFAGKDGQINFYTSFGAGYRQSFTTQEPSVTIMNGQTGFVSDTSQTPFVIGVIPVVGAFPIGQAAPPLPPFAAEDLGGADPRIEAVAQARADANAQAAAQAAAAAQAGGPVQPLPAKQRPNALAPRRNTPAPAADPAPDRGDAAAARLNAAQQSTAGRPALSVAEAKRLHQQEQAAADEEMAALMVRAEALEEDGKPNVAKIYYQRIAKHATGKLQEQARQKLYELQDGKKP
jgi:hypothetical protein